jgi:hypothetical protein
MISLVKTKQADADNPGFLLATSKVRSDFIGQG